MKHAPKILIEFIPHNSQRYETVGDWYYKKGILHIKVSMMSDWRYEVLVAIHELAEVLLCRHRGITAAAVDQFDKDFEAKRQPGNVDEPGDDAKAPYRKEHFFATNIERLLAAELGVDWATYDKEVVNL
jgi:hypothetical protein